MADWREWTGTVYADMGYMNAQELLKHVPLPIAPVQLVSGRGATRIWADVASGRITGLTADAALGDVHMRLAPDLPELALESMHGRVFVHELTEAHHSGREFELTGFSMRSSDGIDLPLTNIRAATWGETDDHADQGEFTASLLELKPLADLGERLPFSAHTRTLLDRFSPAGRVSDIMIRWSGANEGTAPALPRQYQGHGRFDGLVMRSLASEHEPQAGKLFPGTPGFENLSGNIAFTQQGGTLEIDTRDARLSFPGVLVPASFHFDQIATQVQWEHEKTGLLVNVKRVQIAAPEFEFSGTGSWSAVGKRLQDGASPGTLHLDGHFKRLNGTAVVNYLPISIPQATRDWVAHAILAGDVPDATVRVHGDLMDFPFLHPNEGEFRIGGHLQNARLDFGAGLMTADGKRTLWPIIDDIRGELVFERNGFSLTGATGRTAGASLSKVNVKLASYSDPQLRLEVNALGSGPLKSALDYVAMSPVDGWLDHALQRATAKGDMRLNLGLVVPLADVNQTSVKGEIAFAGNDLALGMGIPPFSRMTGKLEFNERGAAVHGINAQALGGPVKVESPASQRPGTQFAVHVDGTAEGAALKFFADVPAMTRVSGRSAYTADIAVRGGALDLQVDSSLQGMNLDMPAPLRKTAGESLPFSLQLASLTTAAERSRGVERETWRIGLGSALGVMAEREHRTSASGAVESRTTRASLGVNIKPSLPAEGTLALVQMRSFDLDAWQALLADAAGPAAGAGSSASASGAVKAKPNLVPMPLTIAGAADELVVADKKFPKVSAGATLTDAGWNVNFTAPDGEGSFLWQAANADAPNGKVRARLRRLNLPQSQSTEVIDLLDAGPDRELPALDIVIDDFELQGRNMGKLEMVANNVASTLAGESLREWRLQKLALTSERASFAATGAFAKRATRFDFTLDVHNIGRFIDEMGIKGAIRDGKAQLTGNVNWRGSPLSIDYPTLTGKLKLSAERGQFLKTEPGIGRLIGVLSLQSLPRRITLDFRDVFSEGFAFDQITAGIQVKNGIASTTDFHMRGVAATVLLEGSADLARETQDMHVLVLPEINAGGASVAYALLANPAIGLGTFLAQWLLREPLAKAFSHEYRITGSWADPKVEDAGRKSTRAAPVPVEPEAAKSEPVNPVPAQ
jgi:uncharacterized protein (TIGR02099 family)